MEGAFAEGTPLKQRGSWRLSEHRSVLRSEKVKLAEEERLRKESEEEQQRIHNEKEQRHKKEKKRRTKLQKEAECEAEMNKKLKMQLTLRTVDFFERREANLDPVLEFARKAKGKKKVLVLSDEDAAQGSSESESETEKLRKKAGKLTISEKRKRGPKPVFEDSPLMVTPSKRTPWTKAKEGANGGRVTRSHNKIKTKMSPYVEKMKKSPGRTDALAKLRFCNQAMDKIRGLDAQELQLICKNEGVSYSGKVEAIFDIARHRTRVAFGEIEGVEQSKSGDFEDKDSTTVDVDEPEAEV
ncbi:hypothetical protein CBR_g6532 [Chara braunii]|uniref:Uncharacterized protein n=1 Tax=Chara braunii TaxID=69332 RepID=A0A388KK28_CHABU|nr:hypothetical protein CBR_g6532 [Chara braunii]|eukprot:GBG70404.1 hypothetical protein CBR_g6532 [Chara braunii]